MNMNVRYMMKYAISTKAKIRDLRLVQMAHITRRGRMEREMIQNTRATLFTSLFSMLP